MPFAAALNGHGLLFDSSFLHSSAYAVLNAFVAINTVMFLALAIVKLLPKIYISDWISSRNQRGESRGIYPEQPDRPADPTAPGDSHVVSSVPSLTRAR